MENIISELETQSIGVQIQVETARLTGFQNYWRHMNSDARTRNRIYASIAKLLVMQLTEIQ